MRQYDYVNKAMFDLDLIGVLDLRHVLLETDTSLQGQGSRTQEDSVNQNTIKERECSRGLLLRLSVYFETVQREFLGVHYSWSRHADC